MESTKKINYNHAIPSVQSLSENTPIKVSDKPAEIEVSEFPVTDN